MTHASAALRNARLTARMTQAEAARRARVSMTSWSDWERGVVRVSPAAWKALNTSPPDGLDYAPRARDEAAAALGLSLRSARTRSRRTIAECARIARVSAPLWSAWEHGTRRAPVTAFALFGEAALDRAARIATKRRPEPRTCTRVGHAHDKQGNRTRAKVAAALRLWPDMSNLALARALGLSDMTVGRHRRRLEASAP